MGNDPDDNESLVRLLLYSNELEIQGLIPCTSIWMRSSVHPEEMETIIDAFEKVRNNLNIHVHPDNQYPTASHLRSLLKPGPALYGKEALAPDVPLSPGAKLLIHALEASDEPLWFLSWGGTNVLAQALQHMDQMKSASDAKTIRKKLRVYTISDQDDTGLWIRVTYPDIFYICSITGWNEYRLATWSGIAGDLSQPMDVGGPCMTKVTQAWLKEHIQIGPFGQVYPDFVWSMEGDSPTFLHLVQNGLGSPHHPHWGSWGGRYVLVDIGGAANHYADARDLVVGKNGQKFQSNYATIWRWRDAYQNDFAARMQWTLHSDRSLANHAPVVVINDSGVGPETYHVSAEVGSEVLLDASQTYDPDGDAVSFNWFQYKEPTKSHSLIYWPKVPDLEVENQVASGAIIKVQVPPAGVCAVNILTGEAVGKGQALHLILEVKDNGSPSLVTYKRVVLQVTNVALQGSGRSYRTMTEAVQQMNR
ncbi:hypothetical protein FDECE_9045 [Fusarium decemcellulare]|nr:hypothetical protein FDECE_9045 [Fusarium decemcellulare]